MKRAAAQALVHLLRKIRLAGFEVDSLQQDMMRKQQIAALDRFGDLRIQLAVEIDEAQGG
jgi:hypothetical protein